MPNARSYTPKWLVELAADIDALVRRHADRIADVVQRWREQQALSKRTGHLTLPLPFRAERQLTLDDHYAIVAAVHHATMEAIPTEWSDQRPLFDADDQTIVAAELAASDAHTGRIPHSEAIVAKAKAAATMKIDREHALANLSFHLLVRHVAGLTPSDAPTLKGCVERVRADLSRQQPKADSGDKELKRAPIPERVMQRLREIPAKDEKHKLALIIAYEHRRLVSEELATYINHTTGLNIGKSRARQMRIAATQWVMDGQSNTLSESQGKQVRRIVGRLRTIYKDIPQKQWAGLEEDVRHEVVVSLLTNADDERAEAAGKRFLDQSRHRRAHDGSRNMNDVDSDSRKFAKSPRVIPDDDGDRTVTDDGHTPGNPDLFDDA